MLQLSVSYVQKEEKWFHTLQTQNKQAGEGLNKLQGVGKNRKVNKHPIHLLDAYEYLSLFKTEMNNHKWGL